MINWLICANFSLYILFFLVNALISGERLFTPKIRKTFYTVLTVLLAIMVLGESQSFFYENGMRRVLPLLGGIICILRPLVFVIWIKIINYNKYRKIYHAFWIAFFVHTVAVVINHWTGWLFYVNDAGNRALGPFVWVGSLFVGTMLCVTLVCFYKEDLEYGNERHGILFIVMSLLVWCVLILNAIGNVKVFDQSMIICFCMYYFYLGSQVYKRDALTNTFNRHNLTLDMERLENRQYEMILIDIDNFKLINDKYGHEKGDEALRTISEIVRKYLPSGCKLYRYGGDEFVVISRKANKEQLESVLEKADFELAEQEYSISRGYATHRALANHEDVIAIADSHMYMDKRKKKSDDIWDMMTGLYNLRGFLDELEVMKKEALSEGRDICLVALDVEHLANINSTYGYMEGNTVIVTVANALQECISKGEIIGHLAGDEFAVALEVARDDETYVQNFMTNFLDKLNQARHFMRKEYYIEVNECDFRVILSEDTILSKEVDRVMYQKRSEKENRRKTEGIANSSDYSAEDDQMVMSILNRNKFKYAFQPIVSAKNGEIVAYEALMRSDTTPMIPPLTILQYAERNGRMYDVERYTFFNVLEYVSNHEHLFESKKVFINTVPGFDLTEEDFELVIDKYGKYYERLVVEITEQKELNEEELHRIEERRRKNGFQLAIDDFGSGCSNTNSLLRYMPNVIKLDRLLMAGIDQNAKKQYFVNSIITFAKQNAMQVLAEGIETEEELKMVIRLGVDYIQGYFTAKPSFEVIPEIAKEIQDKIVAENMKSTASETEHKIYVTGNETELSLVHLALEEYNGLTVSKSKLTLVGGFDYAADLSIKIMDGLDCRLVLRDVKITSVDDLPCIELGENATLTLILEGDNYLQQKGILIPSSSKLIVKGNGNLFVSAKGHDCYGIGSPCSERFGEIILNQSGTVDIKVDGNTNIALGGGIYEAGEGIRLESGLLRITTSGVETVSIGAMEGNVPISLRNCRVEVDARVNTGVVVGCMRGDYKILLEGIYLEITGNGSLVTGIGSVGESNGTVRMISGEVYVTCNGQSVCMIGAQAGAPGLVVEHMAVKLNGAGNKALAIGSWNQKGMAQISQSVVEIRVNAAESATFGILDENLKVSYPYPILYVNDDAESRQYGKDAE